MIEEDRVRTTEAGLKLRFTRVAARVVMEAGTHSPWVSRLLEGLGHRVIVANARKVRLIYESDRKNDKIDARMLARLGRVDVSLLCPIQHRSAEVQADLAQVRSRGLAKRALANAEFGPLGYVTVDMQDLGGSFLSACAGVGRSFRKWLSG